MQEAIKKEIKSTSRRMIAKMAAKNKKFEEHRERIKKRTGLTPFPVTPPKRTNDHFDPYYCTKNCNIISKVIWARIQNGTYKPELARMFDIPKKDGGTRPLTSFSIPDNVVAKLVYRSIVKRNLRAFSPDSYAYLPDRDIFDAIKVLGDTNPHEKTFAIQVDFKKFFDKIPHEFLHDLIGANSENWSPLRITSTERRIIKAFMSHESEKTIIKRASGVTQKVKEKRSVGTPQGSSVSLILANLALHDLDKSLQLKSGKFVRYADDVVALTNNYEQALQVEQAFYDHAHKNDLEINRKKSPGISAFSETEQEIRTTGDIDFLGYRFTPRGTTISDEVEKKIKWKIGRLVNLYLIQYIRDGSFNPARVSVSAPQFDWDLLGLISELRKTIYGGNSEKNISGCLYREEKIKRMYGIMAHYALVDDLAPFARLDGWMVNNVRRAMKYRETLIRHALGVTYKSGLTPNNAQVIDGSWLDMDAWIKKEGEDGVEPLPEVRMPSFVKACKAARLHAKNHGIDRRSKDVNGSSDDLSDLLEY